MTRKTSVSLSRTRFSGAARLRPIRSKARRSPTAPGPASGTASRTRRAACMTTIPATSPAITIVGSRATSSSCGRCGSTAYRFSIAWGRVLPEGVGRINPPASASTSGSSIDCSSHGIQPMATLYHWDLPAALDDRGGWLNRDMRRTGSPNMPTSCFGGSTIASNCGRR